MSTEFQNQKCVRCGRIVDALEVEALAEVGMPACCEHCHGIVWDEVELDGSMWPSGWHGHAMREDESGEWLYSE